jgi:serine O-acetyltransferase
MQREKMTAPIEISAIVADWSRERIQRGSYEPWKRLLLVIRRYQTIKSGDGLRLFLPFLVSAHRFWSAVCGADIPLNSQLGGGLILTHPNGIVIHPQAKIGVNCLIFQQVTIGVGSVPGLPEIGGNVDIGAGAKILGGIRIGDHARIGANSVVITDVPAGATAVGIPAKIIERRADGREN